VWGQLRRWLTRASRENGEAIRRLADDLRQAKIVADAQAAATHEGIDYSALCVERQCRLQRCGDCSYHCFDCVLNDESARAPEEDAILGTVAVREQCAFGWTLFARLSFVVARCAPSMLHLLQRATSLRISTSAQSVTL
jgi:hypothetical protein